MAQEDFIKISHHDNFKSYVKGSCLCHNILFGVKQQTTRVTNSFWDKGGKDEM